MSNDGGIPPSLKRRTNLYSSRFCFRWLLSLPFVAVEDCYGQEVASCKPIILERERLCMHKR